MIKILIVDDEINICKLIKHLIEWDKMNLELVGIAHSGNEAYNMVLQSKPDIIITDIKMNGMDGLELIRKIKEIDDSIKYIIISGYKSFNYAYTAIKYGVVDFLLKPIKKIELNRALQELIKDNNKKEYPKLT
jgi:two-component system response regulator YesN